MQEDPILIAGGGIGGLCCSLSLAQAGIPSVVLEQAENFSEVGAGIQLGPNATRILHNLGLKEHLENYAMQPEGIMIFDGLKGKTLNTVPLKGTVEELYGAPYYTIHRSDLQRVLLQAAEKSNEIEMKCGFEVNHFVLRKHIENITLTSASEEEKRGKLLIGADGLWSSVRTRILPDLHPEFSGKTAWRALIPIELVPKEIYNNHVGLWMGPEAHIVHYPVQSGEMLNIVAVVADDWSEPGWDKVGTSEQLHSFFGNWCEDIHQLLAQVENWKKWALFDLPSPQSWNYGAITLLGDAAHPMMPFLAQGAAMAIEDGASLSHHLRNKDISLEKALLAYQKGRVKRCRRIQKQARRLGEIYHFQGLMAYARNFAINKRTSLSLLKDYNWLYGYVEHPS